MPRKKTRSLMKRGASRKGTRAKTKAKVYGWRKGGSKVKKVTGNRTFQARARTQLKRKGASSRDRRYR